MSGYSKRMMEIAAKWLAANPDPGSPFLKVPGFDKNGGRSLHRDTVDLERYKRIAREVPKTAPLVEKLLQQVAEIDEARGEIHRAESDVEERLARAPTPGHQKSAADLDYHADIGRWCLTWARQGYNVFDLSADFTAAILLTDARELDISDVRLPFSGMLLMIPDGFAKGIEGTSYNKIHVSEVPRRDAEMLTAGEKIWDALKDLPPTEASSILRDLKETPRAASLVGPSPLIERDPADTVIHIYASDGAHVLETWIDRKNLTWDAFDDLPDNVVDDADKQARHTLRQIVFGSIAYTNAIKGSLEERFEPPKKKAAAPKLRAKHWTIGRTILIDPKLVAAVRSGTRETTFRLKSRFIVRGHYRNQAHGENRLLRTTRWISPFWKGPEEGAKLVHTYKPTVDESETSPPIADTTRKEP